MRTWPAWWTAGAEKAELPMRLAVGTAWVATAKARRAEMVESILIEDTRRLRGEVQKIDNGVRSNRMREKMPPFISSGPHQECVARDDFGISV